MSPDNSTEADSTNDGSVIPLHIKNLRSFVDAASENFLEQTTPEEKRENTRGAVTSRIITMYVICTISIIGVGLGKVIFDSSPLKDQIESLKTLVEFLSVLVVPIITLVLGFYFGSGKAHQ
jgi:hypothetical protein